MVNISKQLYKVACLTTPPPTPSEIENGNSFIEELLNLTNISCEKPNLKGETHPLLFGLNNSLKDCTQNQNCASVWTVCLILVVPTVSLERKPALKDAFRCPDSTQTVSNLVKTIGWLVVGMVRKMLETHKHQSVMYLCGQS